MSSISADSNTVQLFHAVGKSLPVCSFKFGSSYKKSSEQMRLEKQLCGSVHTTDFSVEINLFTNQKFVMKGKKRLKYFVKCTLMERYDKPAT